MNELQHLIHIIRKKGQRSLQLVNYNFRKKETSKDNLLYQGIVKEFFRTDEEAARAIFRTDAGNRNYRNAKSKLRSKLLNHLFFLDYEKQSYTLYDQARYDSDKLLLQCKILVREGAIDIALSTLSGLLRTAREFELYDVVVEALRLQRDQYAKAGKLTLFEESNEELLAHQVKQAAFERCQLLYSETIVHINKSVSAQKRIIDNIPEVIQAIQKEAKEHDSDSMRIIAYRLESTFNEVQWQFDENIALCTRLETQYLSGPNHSVAVNLSKKAVAFTKVSAYLHTSRIEEGADYAKSALNLFRPSAHDWFSFAEYYFLLFMKGENYKEAGNLFRRVRTNKHFGALHEDETQRWSVYRAYLIFFNSAKILRWGFNVEEFVQAPPVYANDSFNAAAQIIRFMFLLREGRVNELEQCVEELVQYKSAHLDKRSNYRNSIFIRLLEVIIEKQYDIEAIEEKSGSYHRKLLRNQIPNEITNEVEVVPYEKIWTHIANILRTNKVYTHYRFYHNSTHQTA